MLGWTEAPVQGGSGLVWAGPLVEVQAQGVAGKEGGIGQGCDQLGRQLDAHRKGGGVGQPARIGEAEHQGVREAPWRRVVSGRERRGGAFTGETAT